MAVSGRTSHRISILTETKCKIRFIYVSFNCKRKSGVKNDWKLCPLREGAGNVRRFIENSILNFHFVF